MMSNLRYVVVEGPIGAGKSELARRLADYWEVKLVAEEPEANPFLPRFYRNAAQHGLATQLSFLQQRSEKARAMLDGDLLASPIVSDFLFEKDAVFARTILQEDELALYRYIAARLMPEHPVPDLVIYLQASPDVVQKRVAAKGSDYEMSFPEGFLDEVHAAYSEFFHRYENAPLLIVNTDHLNFVDGDEDFELLLRCITEMRGQRSYFNKSV
ncbi:deoxynucleoside kinase [Crenobacter sp. SG2303]|uniref:Deoxynucleoside kinase n=1 Tax=Crenobacter oryzisoli TaxID=3056844 RepID=A0ABT7XJU7_9NEIS|nr:MULTISPECIES: deoxynucleoside kinase [unclassified Crenobacter]MDN0074061.1 deoxynucleoside kinase [Crenobacter sp. SG2303]MDN0083988.1 deoxynucleoside kinase [Crenobacter sp. SG2305]